MTCDQIRQTHAEPWQRATAHPFLDGVRDGSIDADQLNRWLAQDYAFVKDCARLVARITSVSPSRYLDFFLSTLTVIRDELRWFEHHAQQRLVNLKAAPMPALVAYQDFLGRLTLRPYTVQLVGFWALEAVYHVAWSGARPGANGTEPFVDRWSSREFATFVRTLQQMADDCLAAAPAFEQDEAADAALRVFHLEADFWNMVVT